MKKLALLLLFACAKPPAPAPVGNVATAADEYLVWTVDDRDHATTLWLDATGAVRGRADGVLIAAAGTVWRLEARTSTFRLRTCDQIDHASLEPPAGGDAHVTQLVLVARAGGELALDDALVIDSGADADLDVGQSITSSLGPYVFVQSSVSEYSCGAHGGETVTADAYDLGARALMPLIDGGDATAAAAALEVEPAGAQLVDTVPAFHDGRVGVRHLFVKDDCFACGNGLWSSYTSGAWIDDPALAPPLSALPSVPRGVVAHATTERAGISWGPPSSWRALFSWP